MSEENIPAQTTCAAFNRPLTREAIGSSDGRVVVKELSQGQLGRNESQVIGGELFRGPISAVTFHSREDVLGVGNQAGGVVVVPNSVGSKGKYFPGGVRQHGHDGPVTSVSLRSNQHEAWVIATGSKDGTAIVRNCEMDTRLRVFEHPEGPVLAVALQPGSDLRLATGTGTLVRVFPTTGSKKAIGPNVCSAPVTQLAWNRSGVLLAVGQADGYVNVLDFSACGPNDIPVLRQHFLARAISALAFNFPGDLLVAGCEGQVKVMDVNTGKEKLIEISPESGRVLALGFDYGNRFNLHTEHKMLAVDQQNLIM